LVDDWQDRTPAERALIAALEAGGSVLTAAGGAHEAIARVRGVGAASVLRFADDRPAADVVTLAESFRCPQRILDAAAAVVAPLEPRAPAPPTRGAAGGDVRFWRAANERAQVQQIAAE